MIDITELSYGSWILYDDLPITVEGLVQERVFTRKGWCHKDSQLIQPLPLLPRFVVDLGWFPDPVPNGIRYNEKNSPDTWYVKFWIQDTTIDGEVIRAGETTFGQSPPGSMKKLSYVHELQQLYRWQVGKPLKLNI